MTEKHIYLIRHGQSEQNARVVDMRDIPDHAITLSEHGVSQANLVGQFLKEHFGQRNISTSQIRLWRSPYERTRQTSRGILEHLPVEDVREDEMLTELQFGLFHGLTHEECEARFPFEYAQYQMMRRFNGKYYAKRPNGESPFDCEVRQKLFIDTLYRDFMKNDGVDHIIIVGHGAAINIFRKAFFHYSHEWYEKERNPDNCSVQHICIRPDQNIDAGYIYGGPDPHDRI